MSLRLSAAVVLVFATVCARASAQAQDVLTYRGADRQQVLEEGARKEGQVVLYSAAIVNQALRPLQQAFTKKYPFIRMSFWRGDTEEIAAKLSAETRAGRIVADVVEGTGIGELAVQAGLTQPYFTPVVEEYPAQYRDPSGNWTSTRISYFGAAYNTKLVADDQVPKSYEDLLAPKWQGKLSWRIGTSSGTPLFITNLRLAWGEEKALKYFKALAAQKIVNFGSGSARTLVDRVIAGEYPIALNIFAHHPLISRAKGAPVNTVLLDPVPSTAGTMILPRIVAHPHAAMLLVDFILSKEGQEILAQAEYFPARPDVAPLDVLKPIVPSSAGVRENFITPEHLNGYTESSNALFQEFFR